MTLLRDLRDATRPHPPPPLPDREPQLLLHRDRHDQLDRHRHVVPRHHHLHPLGQRAHPRHVRRPKVKLRPIPVEKRRVPPPLFLRQHVHLRLELLVRLDRARLGQHLPPLHPVLLPPPPQRPPVFPPPPPAPPPRPPLHPPHHRRRVPRKLVLLQQLPHLQLHQIQNLRVVYHVHLVHEHHQMRHVHLPRQQHVLPRLRHRPVVRGHHQNGPVHLRRPRDHVLDVVRVPRTVDVRVVPLTRLVLHVAHRDRDPPLPLLRRVVDRPKLPHRHRRVLRVQHLRDRRRQRRLPVIDVPDRPNVHVRLRPLVLRLRHGSGLRLREGEVRADEAARKHWDDR